MSVIAWLQGHLGERLGVVVEHESGKEVGQHKGFWFHTIGQRQGLGLSNGPWLVPTRAGKTTN